MFKTNYSAIEIGKILKRAKKIFFIGIGGVSMSSLAHISADNGLIVSGSDRSASAITDSLENQGIKIYYEHKAENVSGSDVVIYTAAIPPSNPELIYAKENGIPRIYRADYLGFIMRNYVNRIGISGMHGKSTVTSMVSHVFIKAGANPTVVSGAVFDELEGGTYRTGGDKYFIMEACEYCDSFLSFTPNIAVVLNIEMDHPDYFKDINHIKNSFKKYISIASDGHAVLNWDDENVREISEGFHGEIIKFGIKNKAADYMAENIRYENGYPVFDLIVRDKYITTIKLSVAGEHNILNALATCAVSDLCEINTEKTACALSSYTGAHRRMEYKGKICGGKAEMYEDYAHHPTEIKTTLKGAKMMAGGNLWCVFQPHTFSRTSELFDEFITSFDGVKTIFADIYAARESNETGISSKDLAERVKGSVYINNFVDIADYLRENVSDGDTVIIMGAGDVNKICDLLKEDKE